MKILVHRKYKKADYCISNIYVDGEWFCSGLEDTDRELHQNLDLNIIKSRKIPGKTAIPTGTYKITLDIVSPKFSKYSYYMDVCDGKLPRLLNVPGFDGILIHVGSKHTNTSGCILVGYNKIKGGLTDGKEVFRKLYEKMKIAQKNNEEITIEIY